MTLCKRNVKLVFFRFAKRLVILISIQQLGKNTLGFAIARK